MKRKLFFVLIMLLISSYTFGQYCSASGGGDEYISGVQIGSINNTGTGADGYTDYSATMSTDLYTGQTGASITISNGDSYSGDDVAVWIDWNQDNDFDDTDENVVCESNNGGNGTFLFNVPSGATLGGTIMRIRIKYDGSDCGSPCGTTSGGEVEDYGINVIQLSCPPPSLQTEIGITSSSADLGWTENGTAGNWQIMLDTAGFDTTSYTPVNSTSNPYSAGGLNSSTDYDWYVRSVCGAGDTSDWTGASTFTTHCVAKTVPYSQNFDAVTRPNIPDCWFKTVNSTSSYAIVETYHYSSPHSSPNHIKLYNSSDTSATLLLTTPELSDLTSQNNQIRFWAKGDDDGYTLLVGTMSDPGDTSTFTAYQTITLTYSYKEYTVVFGVNYTETDTYISFKHGLGGSYRDIFIDDFVYEAAPSCPAPSLQTETNIGSYSADLAWLENGAASTWEIELGTSGFTPSGIPTQSGITVNPYTYGSLSGNTSYDWYVRSVCGSGDTSTWTGLSSFKTLCGAVNAPYSENFDAVTRPNIPDCWFKTVNSISSSATVKTYNYYSPHSSPNHIEFYNSNDTSAILLLTTPELSDLTSQNNQIRFWAKGNDDYTLLVGTMSDPGDTSTYVTYQTITLTDSYKEYTVVFGVNYTGTDTYISFKHGLGGGYRKIFIDDFVYEAAPSCPAPSLQTETNIGSSSADLGWLENGTATSWEIELDTSGFTTSGTPTQSAISTNPYTYNGLSGNTDYDWYVRSVCGAGDTSTWTGLSNFKTLCGSYTVPFSENFDASYYLPDCWSNLVITSSYYAGVNVISYNGHSPSNCVKFSNSSDDTATLILVTPSFSDLTSQDNQIRFWAKGDDDNYSFIVGTITDPDDPTTFTPFQTLTLTDTYTEYTVVFGPQYTGSDTHIAFKHGVKDTYQDILFDDFVYEAAPPCPPPCFQTASNISSSSADLGWLENGSATSWDIELDTAGFTSSGTPTQAGITANPYTYGSLNDTTSYDWYVRSNCGSDGYSDWVGANTFRTYCNPKTAPYSQYFDSLSTPEIPACWFKTVFSSSGYIKTRGYSAHSSPNMIELYNSYGQNDFLLLITCELSDLTSQTNQISFYAKSNTNGCPLIVGTMTDPADTSTFVPFKTFTLNYNYSKIIVRFDTTYTGTGKFIAFKHGLGGNYRSIYIDDFVYETAPACSEPILQTVNNTTDSSAGLGWTEVGQATAWEIELDTSNFIPSGAPTRSVVTNPYVYDSLLSNTIYDWYVRAICNGSDTSNWAGKNTFRTECSPVTAPYAQYFDNVTAPTIPFCWSSIDNSTYGFVRTGTDASPKSSPNHVKMYNYSSSGEILMLITPELSDLTTQNNQIRFYAKGSSSGYTLQIGTMSDPDDASTFTVFKTLTLTGNYTQYIVKFDTSYSRTDKYIGFKHGLGGYYRTIYIDNFNYEEIPSCPAPILQTVSAITTSSADLSWTEAGTATSWDIELDNAGFSPTGIPTQSGVANPYTYSNLSCNTYYDWYVRSICGAGDTSLWVGQNTFVTECGPLTASYIESFDMVTPPALAHCWSKIIRSCGTYARVESSNLYGVHSAPNHIRMYKYCFTDTLLLITPELSDLSSQNNQIRFYAKGDDAGFNVVVGTMSDPADVTTFIPYQTLPITTSYEEYKVVLGPNYNKTDSYIAFKHGGTGYKQIYIDNFVYEPAPSCPEPSFLDESLITSSTANLQWLENGSACTWQIMIDTSGFDTTVCSPVTITSHPYIVTGLNPVTAYDWYIRSVCGAGDTSIWAGPVSFVTHCSSKTAPYSENFDALTPPDNPDCWFSKVISLSNGSMRTANYDAHSAPNHIYSDYALKTDTLLFITPEFSDLTSQNNQIRFYAKEGWSDNSELIIGTMTDPGDATTFTPFQTLDLTADYVEYTVVFGPAYTGTGHYIAFMNGLKGDIIYIDDFVYEAAPSCPPPSLLTETGITSTSAVLGWTENGSAASWQMMIDVAGFDTTSHSHLFIGINPTEMDGLTPNTTYDWYIRSACGGGDTSNWVGPSTFKTYCSDTTVPYSQYFDGVTTPALPDCWSKVIVSDNNTTQDYIETSTTASPPSYPNMVALHKYYGYAEAIILVTPAFSDLPSHNNKIRFYSDGNVIVGTMSDPSDANTFTPFQSFSNSYPATEHTVIFDGTYTLTDKYIAFKVDEPGWSYEYVYIDNFIYEVNVTCPAPTIQTETNITTTSADLGWTENGSANSWQIRIDTTGFDTTGYIPENVLSNPYSKTGLSAGNSYDWYVRSVCGAGDTSIWVGAHQFYTTCSSTSPPYFQAFDNVTYSVFPHCLKIEDLNGDGTKWRTINMLHNSSPNCAEIWPSFSYGMNDWFFTRALNLTGGVTYEVNFVYRSSSSFTNRLTVDWGTADTSSAMSGSPLFENNNINSTQWQIGSGTITPVTTGVYYVGFRGHSSIGTYGLCVDDIQVVEQNSSAVWNGTAGTGWADSSNWSTTMPPGATTDVIIPPGKPGYPTLTGTRYCNNLIIQSDASGDGSLIGANHLMINGSDTIERYLTGGKWHEVSAMVNGATINSFFFNHAPEVWMNEYDEPTDTRISLIDLTTPMPLGKGFEAWVDAGYNGTAVFTGDINSGDVTATVTWSDAAHSYNLLGNPFSSALSWDSIYAYGSPSNIDNETWAWDPAAGNYRTYTGSGTGFLTGGIIPMGQGFFVHANAASPALTIPASAQVHSSQAFYKASGSRSELKHITFETSKGEKSDGVWIVFHEGSTEAYESGFDSRKLKGSETSPQLYTVEGEEKFSVDALPLLKLGETRVVSLFFKAGETGEQTLVAGDLDMLPGVKVILEDLKTEIIQVLNDNPIYTFYATNYQNPDRFRVHFERDVNGVDEAGNVSDVRAYAFNKNLYVLSRGNLVNEKKLLTVYDLTGRKLIEKTIPPGELIRIPVTLSNSYVVVRIISNGEVYTTKVFIK